MWNWTKPDSSSPVSLCSAAAFSWSTKVKLSFWCHRYKSKWEMSHTFFDQRSSHTFVWVSSIRSPDQESSHWWELHCQQWRRRGHAPSRQLCHGDISTHQVVDRSHCTHIQVIYRSHCRWDRCITLTSSRQFLLDLSVSLCSRSTPGTISCPICMDSYSEVRLWHKLFTPGRQVETLSSDWLKLSLQIVESGRLVVSTKCGHVFCSQCLRDALTSSHTCPTCRKRLTPRQYHPLYVWSHCAVTMMSSVTSYCFCCWPFFSIGNMKPSVRAD